MKTPKKIRDHNNAYYKEHGDEIRAKRKAKRASRTDEEKQTVAEAQREYQKNKKEEIRAYRKRLQKQKSEEDRENDRRYHKEWREKNKQKLQETQKKWHQERYATDPQYKLRVLLRARLNVALAGGYKKGSAIKLLGCTIEELKKHLESQFQPGMTWKNHGKIWHIDHIVPLANFDLQNLDQLKIACHFTNLQPLTVSQNTSKGKRIKTSP